MGRYTYYYILYTRAAHIYVVLQCYYSSSRRNPVPAIPSITLVREEKRKNTNQKPIKKTFTYYYTIIVHASVAYSCPRAAAVVRTTTKTKIYYNTKPDDIDLFRARPRTFRWR